MLTQLALPTFVFAFRKFKYVYSIFICCSSSFGDIDTCALGGIFELVPIVLFISQIVYSPLLLTFINLPTFQVWGKKKWLPRIPSSGEGNFYSSKHLAEGSPWMPPHIHLFKTCQKGQKPHDIGEKFHPESRWSAKQNKPCELPILSEYATYKIRTVI